MVDMDPDSQLTMLKCIYAWGGSAVLINTATHAIVTTTSRSNAYSRPDQNADGREN